MHHFSCLHLVGTMASNGKNDFVQVSENDQFPKISKKSDKCLTDINQCLSDTCNQYYI